MGDPFVPPPQDTDAYWVCTATANIDGVDLASITGLLDFRNTINDTAFTIDGIDVLELCGWLRGITIGHVQYRNEIAYRPVRYEIACKGGSTIVAEAAREWNGGGYDTVDILDDWKQYKLDMGTRTTVSDPSSPSYGQPIPLVNADGTATRTPAPLNGAGQPLTNPDPSNIIYIAFHLKPEEDIGGFLAAVNIL